MVARIIENAVDNMSHNELIQYASEMMFKDYQRTPVEDIVEEFNETFPDAATARGIQFDRDRHGGLYDRGAADSWYSRPRTPHWYPEGTGRGVKIVDLTPEEVQEYLAGYDENEAQGNHKDWG
jgi:hypothetical protein